MRYRYWFHYMFFVKDERQTQKFTGRIQIHKSHPIMHIEDIVGVEAYIQNTLPIGATLDIDNWKLLAYRDDENAEWKPVLG